MCNLRPLAPDDWDEVAKIYLEGIETRQATFETKVPDWDQWDASHHQFARLVLTDNTEIKGWAALSRVSARDVYAGVAEVSVYVRSASRGEGFGKVLLEALIVEAERKGIWTLQASIFRENKASLHLHSKCGFRTVGYRERIAKLDGDWHDTVLLERRSAIVGLE